MADVLPLSPNLAVHFKTITDMKRTVRIAALAALAVAVGLGSYVGARQETRMTDVMQENVEALAAGETIGDIWCYGVGCVDCPITYKKVYLVKETYGL